MITVASRYGAVLIIVVAFGACSGAPFAPTRLPPPPSPSPFPAPSPVPAPLPPLLPTEPPQAGSYAFVSSPYDVRIYTRQSRFVLHDDGRFALQYPGIGEYRGTYRLIAGLINFLFDGSSVAGAWDAMGSIRDDVLTVRYNLIMQLSDFEDAEYRRVE